MAIAIETARSWDKDALHALIAGQFGEHHIAFDPERLARGIDAVLEDPRLGTFLVARLDGDTVGVAYLSRIWSLEHGGPSAWLDELYVVPARRTSGVGTALLREAVAWARAQSLLAIDLEVEHHQARVESLYQREGFRLHTRRRWVKKL